MKVPNNLLNAVGGKKTNGVALFAALLMALAGLSGAIWGLYAKFAPSADVACHGKNVPDIKFPRLPCDSCGMG